MAKHTPGPWYLGTYTNHKPNAYHGDWCGEIYSKTDGKIYHGPFSFHAVPNEANARLMAAAPELLAACEFALAIAEDRIHGGNWDDVMTAMREVIAKVNA